jgi:hypothetical protein
MAIIGRMTKQPLEVLDYDVDFSEWLPTTDFIATASAVVSPATSLAIGTVSVFDTTWVKVWLSSGVTGTKYKITVTVVTDDGRTKEAEFYVNVKEV